MVGGQALWLMQRHEGALQELLVLLLQRQRKAVDDRPQDLEELCLGRGKQTGCLLSKLLSRETTRMLA